MVFTQMHWVLYRGNIASLLFAWVTRSDLQGWHSTHLRSVSGDQNGAWCEVPRNLMVCSILVFCILMMNNIPNLLRASKISLFSKGSLLSSNHLQKRVHAFVLASQQHSLCHVASLRRVGIFFFHWESYRCIWSVSIFDRVSRGHQRWCEDVVYYPRLQESEAHHFHL